MEPASITGTASQRSDSGVFRSRPVNSDFYSESLSHSWNLRLSARSGQNLAELFRFHLCSMGPNVQHLKQQTRENDGKGLGRSYQQTAKHQVVERSCYNKLYTRPEEVSNIAYMSFIAVSVFG
ncbi:hypothetical protein PoB_005709400 [Plakobranchus ocellatus]|uniref:Uncharacterized protein n=1 Tax=Plakobranchus ocellatus TaxID=259542 RepID=A0AAV4CDA3_9GAST|nr:hypothetical protein PoB_005709400 [Plakobranchus ocellatus]